MLQEAQLPQRDGMTRYVSKFVLFKRDMGVRKVSYSKSDLQGHSMALSFDRALLLVFHCNYVSILHR